MDDQMPDYKCITCGWEGFVPREKDAILQEYN